MKKYLLILLFIVGIFFVRINEAEAFTGPYNYDINSISIVGDTMQLTGWAVVKSGSSNTHNIQPTYTLELATTSGTVVKTMPDISVKPAYSGQNDSPKDFNQSYYEQMPGYNAYPYDTKYNSAIAVRDSGGNYMYINNHFTFQIPLSELGTLLSAHKELKLNIVLAHTGGVKTVYGVDFNTSTFTVRIKDVSAQTDCVQSNVAPTLKTYLGATAEMELHGTVSKVTIVVTNGVVQLKPELGAQNYYCGSTASHYVTGETFDVSQRIVQYNGIAMYDINTYKVGFRTAGGCDAYNGTSHIGYVPATWAAPFAGGGLSLKIVVIYNCKTDPKCGNLSSGSSCPKTCCPQTCKAGGGSENSTFCLSVCNDPFVGGCGTTAAKNDPLKMYCCEHPQDSAMCGAITGEYPKGDPINKPKTCTVSGVTDVNFKYPIPGWGYNVLNNNACRIACQEKVKATFQPQQSVRAGMGFAYPVGINSSRYCVADFDNDGWKTKVDAASTAANTAYNNMVSYVNQAKALDTACGTKLTLTSTPSCPCGNRSGMTCNNCTCSGSSCSHCGSHSVSCASLKNPSCRRSVCDHCSWTCSKSASCPSGYSYRHSLDKCARDVCNNNTGKLWSTAQAEISSRLSTASSYRSQYNSFTATVNTLNGERSTCNNYVAANQYNGSTGTKISVNVPNQTSYAITSASHTEDTAFESTRLTTWTTYSIYQCNSRSFSAPYLVGDYSASSFSATYCNFQTANQSYRDFWNKKSDASVKLEFSTAYYVQRYTGNLNTSGGSGYDYDGHYSYTDYFAKSSSNNFSLAATKIGPNLPSLSNSLWSINPFTCQYNVTNLIFPPTGDSQNVKYGNVAFMYRQVSLDNPFPNRNPGENWRNKASLITSNGYKVYANTPLYTINLTPNVMQSLRGYGTNYGSYNTKDPNISIIVDTYIKSGTIIKRK